MEPAAPNRDSNVAAGCLQQLRFERLALLEEHLYLARVEAGGASQHLLRVLAQLLPMLGNAIADEGVGDENPVAQNALSDFDASPWIEESSLAS